MGFEIKKPRAVWSLDFEGAWPTSVAFCGSHRRIVAGSRAGVLLVWELPEELPEPPAKESERAPSVPPARQLLGHENGIARLVAHPNGRTVLSASLDRSVRLWDLDAEPTGESEVVVDITQRRAEAKKTRKDDVLERPGFTVRTSKATHVFEGHDDWVLGLGLDATGKRMVSGDDGGRTIVHEFAGRREVRRLEGHPMNGVVSTALSPDGRMVFVSEYRAPRGDFDRPPAMARLFDVETGEVRVDLLAVQFPDVKQRDNSYGYHSKWSKFVGRGFVCSAFSPDGKLLAVGQGGEIGDAKVHLVDTETGKVVRTVSNHRYGVCDVAFSADGEHLVTSGRDTTAKIVNVADGKTLSELGRARGGQFKDWVHAVAVSPDQRWIAGADIAGRVHVWKLSN